MIVVGGVDLGLRKVHVFAVHDDDRIELFDVNLKRGARRDSELKEIYIKVSEYFSGTTAPFFIEEPVVAGARNIRVSLGIAQTAGAVAVAFRGAAYFVPVSTWKSRTVGKGNATKDQVKEWLSKEYVSYSVACEGTNSPQDYADAACVAIYGNQMLGIDRFNH